MAEKHYPIWHSNSVLVHEPSTDLSLVSLLYFVPDGLCGIILLQLTWLNPRVSKGTSVSVTGGGASVLTGSGWPLIFHEPHLAAQRGAKPGKQYSLPELCDFS